MKKTLFLLPLALLFGCADEPPTASSPQAAVVQGGASAWATVPLSGTDAAWVATSDGDPNAVWEGYPNVFQSGHTYEATIESWRRVRITPSNPAFKRFGSRAADSVDVRIVDLRFPLRKGDGASDVIVPTFLPLSQFVAQGQSVLVRPVSTSATGFLKVAVAAQTRFSEGYNAIFAANAVYVARVSNSSLTWLSPQDPAFARVASATRSGGERIEGQVLTVQVVTDSQQLLTTVVMPTSPVFRSGDLVYFRTFGDSAAGFADVQLKQQAANGDVPRQK